MGQIISQMCDCSKETNSSFYYSQRNDTEKISYALLV